MIAEEIMPPRYGRCFKIEYFKNIKDTVLFTNTTMESGISGGIVLLIGPNNSGKSNVIKALQCYANPDQIDASCVSENHSDKKPMLKLYIHEEEGHLVQEKSKGSIKISLVKDNGETTVVRNEYNLKAKQAAQAILEAYNKNPYNTTLPLLKRKIDAHEKLTEKEATELHKFVPTVDKDILLEISELPIPQADVSGKIEEKLSLFNNKIVSYEPTVEWDLTNGSLLTKPEEIKKSVFYTSIFKLSEISLSDIEKAYASCKAPKHTRKDLDKIEEKTNKKLNDIADQFNKIYKSSKNNYRFEISAESRGDIFFKIFEGDEQILLDYQSTGFRWFFNFYFSFLSSNTLSDNDIILMDEPATHIHPRGQAELVEFLREFSQNNNLTFVISTHSPFFIDVDYLEELRVVSKDNAIAKIENMFTAIDKNDSDCIKPIKEALTVEKRVLYDENNTLVFVEGITDYIYLTAFKKCFQKKNIFFIPINGLGGDKKDMKRTIDELVKIRKTPVILVDGDDRGKGFKKMAEGVATICLSDIEEKFTEIEKLFDPADVEKYSIYDIVQDNSEGQKKPKKRDSFVNAVNFKKSISGTAALSDETVENFKRLFETLETYNKSN